MRRGEGVPAVVEEVRVFPSLRVHDAGGATRPRHDCVVCGKKATKRTGYIYFEDGGERVGAPWCEEHVRQLERFANPIFESPKALERFRAEHPRLYERDVAGREVIFLRREEGAA
jgi:hypothetical protein